MVRTLQKSGNSASLIIPKPVLELMGVEEGGSVKLTLEGHRLIVEPAPVDENERFNGALDAAIEQFGPAFRKLAE
jgi:antitoxin component of MazEF toxin-antitoxin module